MQFTDEVLEILNRQIDEAMAEYETLGDEIKKLKGAKRALKANVVVDADSPKATVTPLRTSKKRSTARRPRKVA